MAGMKEIVIKVVRSWCPEIAEVDSKTSGH